MTKHTPGPWITYEDRLNEIGIYMRDDDGSCGPQVARVLTEDIEAETIDQARADARLIAAAPELLRVLKINLSQLACRHHSHSNSGGCINCAGYRDAVAAIETATGR